MHPNSTLTYGGQHDAMLNKTKLPLNESVSMNESTTFNGSLTLNSTSLNLGDIQGGRDVMVGASNPLNPFGIFKPEFVADLSDFIRKMQEPARKINDFFDDNDLAEK